MRAKDFKNLRRLIVYVHGPKKTLPFGDKRFFNKIEAFIEELNKLLSGSIKL